MQTGSGGGGAHPWHRSPEQTLLRTSALQLTALSSLSSKLSPVNWGRVVLDRSGGQGCSIFIYTQNGYVFLLYQFLLFLLKELHFGVCVWE